MSCTPELVCVTGANGGLGRSLACKLGDESISIVGTSRHAPDEENAARFQRFVACDITEADWPRVIEGCSAVFHLAAYVHKVPRTAEEEREVYAVNTEATTRLAAACRASGAMLIFASSVAVYGPPKGKRPGDQTPVAPVTPYAKSKWQSEEAIRKEGEKGLRYVILRFPLLFGCHSRGNMERLLKAIAKQRYWPLGDPNARKSCLSLRDAAEAAYRAWRAPEALGKTFVVAPEAAPTIHQIHEAAYRALGRKVPRPYLPRAAALTAAGAVDRGVRILGRRSRLSDQVATLTESTDYDGSSFATATGFRPAVDLLTGFTETLQWLQESSPPRPAATNRPTPA